MGDPRFPGHPQTPSATRGATDSRSIRYHGKPEKRESGSRMLLSLKRNASHAPFRGILPQYPPLGGISNRPLCGW